MSGARALAPLLWLALFAASCFLRPPYAVVVVRDPHGLADKARALELSVDGGAWTRFAVSRPLGAEGLELTVVREAGGEGLLRVRALESERAAALARGHAAGVVFGAGDRRYEIELSPPCDAGSTEPGEIAPQCADTPGCAGVARCSVEGECHCGFCGDLLVDPGEGCDDGNDNPNDACDACTPTVWQSRVLVGGSASEDDPRRASLAMPAALRLLDDGSLLVADTGNARVLRWDAQTGRLVTIAGNGQPSTSGDGGRATSAGLVPVGLAEGPDGSLYVSDIVGRRVRRVSPGGVITTLLAAGPVTDGAPTSPWLEEPVGLAIDPEGHLLVADAGSHVVLRIRASGELEVVAGTGTPGAGGEGELAHRAPLDTPIAVAVDESGAIYIADTNNHRVRRIDPRSGIVRTVAGTGDPTEGVDGVPATASALWSPTDVAVGPEGSLYIADRGSHRVRRIDPAGRIWTVAGTGVPGDARDGSPAHLTALRGPSAVALGAGRLFIAEDAYVREVDLGDGRLWTRVGSGTVGEVLDGEAARAAPLSSPRGLLVDTSGRLLLADSGHHRIRRVAWDAARPAIETVVGSGRPADYGDLPAGEASRVDLYFPLDLVEAPTGEVLFTTDFNVARYDPASGEVDIVAGTGAPGTASPGQLALEAGMEPVALALDGAGRLFVGTRAPSQVLRVDLETGALEVVLADVSRLGVCSAAGPRPPQCIDVISDLAALPDGRVAVADEQGHRVVALSVGGAEPEVIAGSGGVGLGVPPEPGTAAREALLPFPSSLAVTPSGDLWIGGFRYVARVSTGLVAEVFGGGTRNGNGDGGPAAQARFSGVLGGLALDAAGHLFIAESTRGRVRRVDGNSGVITTVVGAVEPPGLGALASARLLSPRAIAALPQDRFLVAGGASGRLLLVDAAQAQLSLAAGTPDGAPLPLEGSLPAPRAALFGDAAGVAFDPWTGDAFVSDAGLGAIVRVDEAADRPPEAWKLSRVDAALGGGSRPAGLAFDEAERALFVADVGGHRVLSLQVDTGEVRVLAGTGTAGFGREGEPAGSARFYAPEGVASGPSGSLYVADTGNHRVRRVDRYRGTVETVLGTGDPADSGAGSPAADFPVARPSEVATDRFGNLYVVAGRKLRQVSAGPDGRADGSDEVRVLYEAAGEEEACLRGVAVTADDRIHVVDECRGALLELYREAAP